MKEIQQHHSPLTPDLLWLFFFLVASVPVPFKRLRQVASTSISGSLSAVSSPRLRGSASRPAANLGITLMELRMARQPPALSHNPAPRILVVDDDSTVLDTLRLTLE